VAYLNWRCTSLWNDNKAVVRMVIAAGSGVGKGLQAAAEAGCLEGVRFLLQAAPHERTIVWEALCRAAGCMNRDGNPAGCVEALLGADPGDPPVDGAGRLSVLSSPLHEAAGSCHPDHVDAVIRLLAEAGLHTHPAVVALYGPGRSGLPLVAAACRYGLGERTRREAAVVAVLTLCGEDVTPATWAHRHLLQLSRADKAALRAHIAWAKRRPMIALRRRLRQAEDAAYGARAASEAAAIDALDAVASRTAGTVAAGACDGEPFERAAAP
jgi:hypothetical protein